MVGLKGKKKYIQRLPTYGVRCKVTGRTPRWKYLGNLPDTACYTGNSKLVLSPTSCCIIAHSVVCIDGMGCGNSTQLHTKSNLCCPSARMISPAASTPVFFYLRADVAMSGREMWSSSPSWLARAEPVRRSRSRRGISWNSYLYSSNIGQLVPCPGLMFSSRSGSTAFNYYVSEKRHRSEVILNQWLHESWLAFRRSSRRSNRKLKRKRRGRGSSISSSISSSRRRNVCRIYVQ